MLNRIDIQDYTNRRLQTDSSYEWLSIFEPFFYTIPLIFTLLSLMYIFVSYFSFNVKYKYNPYMINYILVYYFIYIMCNIIKRNGILMNSYFQRIYDTYIIHNNYYQLFSYYISNNLFFFLYILIFLTISFIFINNIKKNNYYLITNRKYVSYLISIYIVLIILFYSINTELLFSSTMNFLNTIMILECFTLLTIYISMNVNISILNSLIIYFFYSVFGYLFFIISCALFIYVNGSDLISIAPSISNEYFKALNTNYLDIINVSNFLFFISFSLKLYLFPFSNIIDKLYSSINISEIILISFFFVPVLYLITIQFLSIINWFSFNSQMNSNTLLIITISIITFIYSISTSINKSNLKSLIAYSSINTSSLFLLLISLSKNITIEWFNFFYIYQIVYLIILLIFISLLVNIKTNIINQSNFNNLSNALINIKSFYIITALIILAITMVLPPLFFIKIELINSFMYLQIFDTLKIYDYIYMFTIIIYTTSSYIFYIRIFKAFKLININDINDKKQLLNKKIINLFKKNEI